MTPGGSTLVKDAHLRKAADAEEPGFHEIDRANPVPFYYQLQEILKEEIEGGRWKPGDLLPSEAEMTEIFGVSRSVTRKALDVLEGDGQVVRVKGKGTLVAEPKFRYEAVGAAAEWRKGSRAHSRLTRVVAAQRVPVGGHLGRLLQLSPRHQVFELTFTHATGDSPTSVSQMFLRADATSALREVDVPELRVGGRDVLAQLCDRYGLTIHESHLSIEATRANRFEAELLEVKIKSPVFLLTSVEFTEEQVPVAFTRTVARADHFRFSAVVQLSESFRNYE